MIFGLALLIAALVCAGVWLLPAFQFLRRYEQKLAGSSSQVRRTELKLPQVQLHIYRPPKQNGSTLVIVPGLHPDGIYDRRFTTFAETCAEAGFQVVAPDILEFRSFHITNQSVDTLRSVMDALPENLPADTRKNVGMLGISYGAGPVFLVAADRKVDFLVSIGGYYNLLHALEYSFTGAHPGGSKRSTHEWGLLIFALNHIEELAPPEDVEILRKSLSLRLKLKEGEAEALERELSPGGKELIQGILHGLSDDQKNAFLGILQRRKDEAFAVSPESVLSRIHPETRVYLLHGTSDDAIPYEETLELKTALEKAGLKPTSLVTSALTHVDFTKVSGIWELLKLLHWERLLLRESNEQ